jgi:multisubunit Na+/H+ antiporter MnhF subunit
MAAPLDPAASVPLHPVASQHLPSFITPPGETDVLMIITAGILAVSILMFGILFLRLHSLPERMAHGGGKLQFEIVAVLCLLALLTHIHAFWVAALLLALIDFPDIPGWLGRITGAVERIAGLKPRETATVETATAEVPQQKTVVDTRKTGPVTSASEETKSRPAKQKEATHA